MKRSIKSASGVTLLEIMLVLAIAAMIIVMSIRYYQNATNSQNANAIVEQIQNITAAADNLAIGANSYSKLTTSSLGTLVGTNNMKTPYNTPITLSGPTPTSYTVTVGTMPTAVCTSVASKLAANSKYSGGGSTPTCSGNTVTYTYDSTK